MQTKNFTYMEYGKKKRAGNFTLLKYRKGEESVMRIEASSGEWAMEWGMHSRMFMLLDMIESQDDLDGLSVYITEVFAAASIMDAGFIRDVLGAVESYVNRTKTEAGEEENREIMDEIEEFEEMSGHLKDFVDGDNGREAEGGTEVLR